MKLFQQMLVAGAALSFLAPVAAQASEAVNLDGMNSYSRSKSKSSRFDSKTFINEVSEHISNFDGLDAIQNDFEAGSFSDTTTLKGKVVGVIGAIDHPQEDASAVDTKPEESLQVQYQYTMDLNTSFTGDDNLYVRLRSGNGSGSPSGGAFGSKTYGTYLVADSSKYGDELNVDKIWYEFPIGERNTVWVGPKIENYYMHATAPSIYKPVLKQFTLGGNGAAYGASTKTGAGYAFKADNGFAFSTNVVTAGNSTSGFLTEESVTSWANQIGYTKDQYSASLMVNLKYNGWEDSYFSTTNGHKRINAASAQKANSTNYGLRGWWRPVDASSATPSISLGYDFSSIDDVAATIDETDAWFVGLNWVDVFRADDKVGIALGQPQTREDEVVDPLSWEAYYEFKVNDSVSVTPAIFGASDRKGTAGEDMTGALIQTTLKF